VLTFNPHRQEEEASFSREDWITCLRLATLCELKSLRQIAIDYLSKNKVPGDSSLDASEKFTLGVQNRIPTWILSSVPELSKLTELLLTQEEKERIGLEAVVKLYEIREELGEKLRRANDTTCHGFTLKKTPGKSTSEGLTLTTKCPHCSREQPVDMVGYSRIVIAGLFKEVREIMWT